VRLIRALLVLWLGSTTLFAVSAAASPTTTTLTASAGGSAITNVSAGTVVTLTASVNSGAVTTGLVDFCDATATYCTDIHLLGSAQLTSAGTAVFKLIPGIGAHSYRAVFVGTTANASSSSATASLTVSKPYPTMTTINQVTGEAGNYTISATLIGSASSSLLTGSLSILDTSNANATVATTPLAASTGSTGFTIDPIPPGAGGGAEQAIVAGDFNGDGKPDVAIVNANNTVSIYLGNGDGTFHAGAKPSTGSGPLAIVAGDFNGDGKLDLAVANSDNTVTVLLGNGDGSFTAAASATLDGAGPASMAVADFNGDGRADLAVSSGTGSSSNPMTLTVLLGNGDGSFNSASQTCGVVDAGSIAVGDFNGDGRLDLAVGGDAPSDQYEQDGLVTLLLGNGDGTFRASPFNVPLTGVPGSIAVADFNGDGKLDFIVGTIGYPAPTDPMGVYVGETAVFLGNGDGTFAVPITTDVPANTGIVVADFNGDGKPDVAFSGLAGNPIDDGGDSVFTVLLGNGNGSFGTGPDVSNFATSGPIPIFPNPGTVMVTADFNGDGFPDLAALGGTGTSDSQAATLLYQIMQTVSATLTGVSPSGTGTHQVEASYAGDSSYGTSVSATVPLLAGTPVIVISPLTLPGGLTRTAYNQALAVTGGTAPYQFKVSAGTLPSGLSLSSGGILSGTPALPGTYLFTVTVTDSTAGTPNTNSIIYALVIQMAPPPTIIIAPATLPAGTGGVAYSQMLTSSGGTPPYSYSGTGFPNGINLSSSGVISGTPTASGNFSVTVGAGDSSSDGPFYGTIAYNLVINPAPTPSYTLGATPKTTTVTAGQSAKYTVTVTPTNGFFETVTFSCGALPTGAACSFTPASVTPGSSPVNSVLTVTTTASSNAHNDGPNYQGRTTSIVSLALLLLYLPRRFRGKLGWLPVLLAGVFAAGLMSSCGGNSQNTGSSGTPAGTYQIGVAATLASDTTVAQETAVTLVVQ
jgi:hypothetical protein